MTAPQFETFKSTVCLLLLKGHEFFEHGGCVGADFQAHNYVADHVLEMIITIHPGPQFTPDIWGAGNPVVMAVKPNLVRNHDIVDMSDIVIATPWDINGEPKSGTWATIRYTMKSNKDLIIIGPNGNVL